MIFVDTSAWYAAEAEDDEHHGEARRFLGRLALGEHGVAVTSDYILDETLTLMRSRGSLGDTTFMDKIRRSSSVKVFWVDEALFDKALDVFQRSQRNSWSFTDCTSFALMKELEITDAFAFDHHFAEAGFTLNP